MGPGSAAAAAVRDDSVGSGDGSTMQGTLSLTPAQHGTDGFFVALFQRAASAVIPEPERSEGVRNP
jgi:16S rRNA C967 or C1407 C5-methylase (RsmB/RsmF family)